MRHLILALLLLVSMARVTHAQSARYGNVHFGVSNRILSSGTGSPEGVLTGNVGDVFSRIDGATGTVIYIKESGNGTKFGWAPVSTIGPIGLTGPTGATGPTGLTGATGPTGPAGSGGSGGSGSPGGTTGQLQYNSAGTFAGSTMTTSGANLVFPSNADRFLSWAPSNLATQNGSWTCRGQENPDPFFPSRRDDVVKCGWNLDSEVPGMNSSSLTFESFYQTSAGIRQSETYFQLSDGLGHSHRPWGVYYDLDANVSTTLLSGDTFIFENQDGSVIDGTIDTTGLTLRAGSMTVGGGSSTEIRTDGPGAAVEMILRPKGNADISLQTSAIDPSAPLIVDSARLIKSGSFSGTTTKLATVSGTLTNGHVAAFDTLGNVVDGGAGASGCTVTGGNGAVQYDDGSAGCAGSAEARYVNPNSLQQNNSSGGVSQIILQSQGGQGLRIQSGATSGGSFPRLIMADPAIGDLDVALARCGPKCFEVNDGTDGVVTGTTLNLATYKAGGTAGVTVSGTSCTITAIKGGIITAATCTP